MDLTFATRKNLNETDCSVFSELEMSRQKLEPGIKGRDALGRRVWDREYFQKLADESAAMPMRVGKIAPAQKDHFKARTADVGLDKIINNKSDGRNGYWCETCEVLMKDSQSYLDHINGRNHNRLLGMSLDVEASSAEKVAAKIRALKGGQPELKRPRIEPQPQPEPEPEPEDEEAAAIAKLIGKSSFSSTKK